MVRAWRLDSTSGDAVAESTALDEAPLDVLRRLGVLHWRVEVAGGRDELDRICGARGYCSRDEVRRRRGRDALRAQLRRAAAQQLPPVRQVTIDRTTTPAAKLDTFYTECAAARASGRPWQRRARCTRSKTHAHARAASLTP